MIIVVLVVLGLCLGSFVNALVWRLHENEKHNKTKHSIINGRSKCPRCKHQLSALDLVPVFSWLLLRGKCRYCKASISPQYPVVELTTSAVFVGSYIWWPALFDGLQYVIFSLWLGLVVGFMALTVYDLRWFLLPNKILQPMAVLAGAMALLQIGNANEPLSALINTVLAVLIGGGIFYLLFQVSGGKWIGGGDVKLGALIGLIVGTPSQSLLVIFLASLLGTLVSLPLMYSNRLKRNSVIPFGPFLIVATLITVLFGSDIIHWYMRTFVDL